MDISFDPGKRAETLRTRGLADAGMVFAGRTVSVQDVRLDCAEDRFLRPATAAVASYP